MIDYSKFQMSLMRLEAQYENYRNLDPSMPDFVQEAMAESIIHRFETCHDCLWKALKRHMVEDLGIPEVPNSPKPIFRRANENDLLTGPIEDWMDYTQRRIDTSHDYSAEKAEACLEIAEEFIEDAIGVYQTITGATWE